MRPAEAAPVKVRPIREADIPGYHACLEAVAREGRYLLFRQAPPLAKSRGFVQLQLEERSPMQVADQAGRIVGWCDIFRETQPGTEHRGTLGIGVHAECRGTGVGWRLLEATLVEARAAGIERVELEVLASNARAIRFYECRGFVREGTLREGRKLEGVAEDIHLMALFLR